MSMVEAKIIPQLVLQVTLVGKVYQLRVIDCKQKCWGVYVDLAQSADVQPVVLSASFAHRRGVGGQCVSQDIL